MPREEQKVDQPLLFTESIDRCQAQPLVRRTVAELALGLERTDGLISAEQLCSRLIENMGWDPEKPRVVHRVLKKLATGSFSILHRQERSVETREFRLTERGRLMAHGADAADIERLLALQQAEDRADEPQVTEQDLQGISPDLLVEVQAAIVHLGEGRSSEVQVYRLAFIRGLDSRCPSKFEEVNALVRRVATEIAGCSAGDANLAYIMRQAFSGQMDRWNPDA